MWNPSKATCIPAMLLTWSGGCIQVKGQSPATVEGIWSFDWVTVRLEAVVKVEGWLVKKGNT